MFSLFETTNVFIDVLCYSKIHFHQYGPFKLIKTMLKSLHVLLRLSPVWNPYPKGSHKKGVTYSAYRNSVNNAFLRLFLYVKTYSTINIRI